MNQINLVRSKIHDRARQLALSADAERAVAAWLDGKANPYGEPRHGHTPHDIYWMTKSLYSAFTAINTFILRFPGDAAELLKLQQFVAVRTNWENPANLYSQPVDTGPTEPPRQARVIRKEQLRELLKEKGVQPPPNIRLARLEKMAAKHGIL